MAYTQSSLVNVLFKKFITGKAQTSDTLAYYSEPYNSRSNVFYNDIWLQSDQIPNTAATVSGVTTFVSVTMSYYVNSSNSGGYYDSTGVLKDIIPFNYGDGSSYAYQIFRYDGVTSIPLGQCDWLLDPNSGVLTFYTGAVGGTVNNGVSNIATPAAPPVVKAWKYVGLKSVIPNLYGLTYSGGTMSISPSLFGTGLTYSGGVLSTTITAVAGNGLTANGNTFSVQLQTNSGLTVSSSGLSLNPTSVGAGLTFSGNIISTLLQTNSGLTVSSSGLSLNASSIGSGLTFSSGILSNTAISTAGVGLTFSGNTHSVLLQTNSGLTVSSSGLGILFGSGLTFSGGLAIATSSVYVQGGNSFGATATLGTNDNYNIQVVAGGNKIIQFGTNSITLNSPINNNIQSYTNMTASNITLTATSSHLQNVTAPSQLVLYNLPDTSTIQIGQSFRLSCSSTTSGYYIKTFSGIAVLGSSIIYVKTPVTVTCIATDTNASSAWALVYHGSDNGTYRAIGGGAVYSDNYTSTNSTTGIVFNNGFSSNVSNLYTFQFYTSGGAYSPSSGSSTNIRTIGNFGPTQGTANYAELLLSTNIGSTSSALGSSAPVRGIYITPAFSNSYVWDYRSIETTQGKVVFNDSISTTGSSIGSLLTLNQTWNTTGTASIFVVNATDTNSGINSKLLDLQKNSVSQYSVDKNGNVSMSGNLVVGVTAGPRTVTVSGTLSTANFILTGAPSTTAATYSYLVRNNATNNIELSGVYSGPPLQMYGATYLFTPSVLHTFTHSLSSTDFIIQMYDTTTGDEVMAQYSNRTINTVDITVFDVVTARIVIIG